MLNGRRAASECVYGSEWMEKEKKRVEELMSEKKEPFLCALAEIESIVHRGRKMPVLEKCACVLLTWARGQSSIIFIIHHHHTDHTARSLCAIIDCQMYSLIEYESRAGSPLSSQGFIQFFIISRPTLDS